MKRDPTPPVYKPAALANRLIKPSVRSLVQLFFFLLIGYLAIGKILAESIPGWTFLPEISLHAICPFGGIVTLYQLAVNGTFIQKIHESAVILAALSVILALFAGPVICGWVCPLGTIQDWIGRIGKKLFKRKYNTLIPENVHRILRYLRYAVMIWVIVVTAVSGKLLFSSIDPYYALFHFWTSEAALGGIIILIVTLIASLFVTRPWCKYACPYGAFLGLLNQIRLFTIHRKAASCISCNRCNQVCPMNIRVSDAGKIRDAQCISCLECTSDRACPVSDTVNLTWTFEKSTVEVSDHEN